MEMMASFFSIIKSECAASRELGWLCKIDFCAVPEQGLGLSRILQDDKVAVVDDRNPSYPVRVADRRNAKYVCLESSSLT